MVRPQLRWGVLPRSLYMGIYPRRSPYFPDIGAFLLPFFILQYGSGVVRMDVVEFMDVMDQKPGDI